MTNKFDNITSFNKYIGHLLPSVITMILLSLYTTVDGYFVSKYAGSDALAGINIVIPITCIIFGVAIMMATGSGAIIGKFLGERKIRDAKRFFSFVSITLIVFSLCFTLIGILFLEPIAISLGSSLRLLPHVLPYELVTFLATLPMVFKLFFEYIVRNEGRPEIAMAMSLSGVILNVVLDYIFVGMLDFGTLGAAVGTALSITISCLIGLFHFTFKSTISFSIPKFSFSMLSKSMINGSGEMLNEFSTGIITFLFNIITMKYYGENGVAAATIIMYIYYFFIALFMGISVTNAPIVSYSLGERNSSKIRITMIHSFKAVAISSVIIIVTMLLAGKSIIGLFVEEGTVFDITYYGLKYFSILFVFIGINLLVSGYFAALGRGVLASVISSLRSLVFVSFFILVLPPVIGPLGIWISMPLSEIFTLFISILILLKFGSPEKNVNYYQDKTSA